MFEQTHGDRLQPAPLVSLPDSLSKSAQRDVNRSAETAVVAASMTDAATMVTWHGLRGAETLAGQLVSMHERHGDVALYVAKPIIEGYGARVRSIIEGMG